MSLYRLKIDHIVTTRVEVEVDARTRDEAERAAKQAVLPQHSFNASIKTLKRRSKTTRVAVLPDAQPW